MSDNSDNNVDSQDNIVLEETPRIKNDSDIEFLQYFFNRWYNLKLSQKNDEESDDDDETNSAPLEIEMFHKDWIRKHYYNESDSPCSSNSCRSLFSENGGKYRKWPTKYKKLTYRSIEREFNRDYHDYNHQFSSALDILACYLKGHKIIYMEAKYYSETRLNALMMPSILLSAGATVLANNVQTFEWGHILLACVNAVIGFLLTLVTYLKLDAAAEAHKISSHHYDKLQSSVEFMSGSVLLFKTIKYKEGTEQLKSKLNLNKRDSNFAMALKELDNERSMKDNVKVIEGEMREKLEEVEKK